MVMVKYNTNFMGLPHLILLTTYEPVKRFNLSLLTCRLNGSCYSSQFDNSHGKPDAFLRLEIFKCNICDPNKKWGQTPWVLGLLKRIYNELLSSLTFQREIFNWNFSSKLRVSNIKTWRLLHQSWVNCSFWDFYWFFDQLKGPYWKKPKWI